jgi:hypothetical protein
MMRLPNFRETRAISFIGLRSVLEPVGSRYLPNQTANMVAAYMSLRKTAPSLSFYLTIGDL